ncbi:hypothetical protein F7018_11730 [Tenacibaculum aiptasiae]|uniref:Uncharacterized protein n=1 Tax=Tenacibaculum aiptasiae TaxID=426481 RepID=A0A7J5ACD6_9FLAO|nr:hypothetical protein [Tenacibaculum aiptasiae]KAB1155143.1 hypothetical protein F7018_11730 [Tenacibaculum aiptasiae]
MSTISDYDKISLKYFISNVGVLNDLSSLSSIKSIYSQRKSYQNEIEIYKTDGNLNKVYQNFYEFYINDKPLSFILDEYFENKTPIIYNWVGMIGAFSKKLDLITIKLLLKQEIKKNDVIGLYKRNNKTLDKIIEENGYEIDQYFEQYQDENIHIYGCPRCGELDHGGYFVKIKKKEGYYQWEFGNESKIPINSKYKSKNNNEKDKLIIKFDEDQYTKTFYNYMKMKNIVNTIYN